MFMRFYALFPVVLLVSACAPKSELDTANQQIMQLQQQVSSLQQQLQQSQIKLERKPELPINVGCREALTGPGLVAVFSTTIKKDFPILVTWRSQSLGTAKQFRLELSSDSVTELGHAEGAVIEAGDTFTVENNNYETDEISCIL